MMHPQTCFRNTMLSMGDLTAGVLATEYECITMGKLKGTETCFCQATHSVRDLYPKTELLCYLDGFEFGWVVICVLLQNMPGREAQGTQPVQDGPIKPTKCCDI
jgi:hypothetical protein